MSIQTEPPRGGVWAWRDNLPASIEEWLELRNRVIDVRPAGVDIMRFSDWVLAEMRGDPSPVTSSRTLPKYRRTLYELAQTAPAPKRRRRARDDSGQSELGAAVRLAVAAVSGAAVAAATGNAAAGGATALAVLTTPRIPADESYVELELKAAA